MGGQNLFTVAEVESIRAKVRASKASTASQWDVLTWIQGLYSEKMETMGVAVELVKPMSAKQLRKFMDLVTTGFTGAVKARPRSRKRQIAMTSYRNIIQCHCVLTAALDLGDGTWVDSRLFLNVDATTIDVNHSAKGFGAAVAIQGEAARKQFSGNSSLMQTTSSTNNNDKGKIGDGFKVFTVISASGVLALTVICFKLDKIEVDGLTKEQMQKPLVVELEDYHPNGSGVGRDPKCLLVGTFPSKAKDGRDDAFSAVVLPEIANYIAKTRMAMAEDDDLEVDYDGTSAVPHKLTAVTSLDGAIPELKAAAKQFEDGGILSREKLINVVKYSAKNTGKEQPNDAGKGYPILKRSVSDAENLTIRYDTALLLGNVQPQSMKH